MKAIPVVVTFILYLAFNILSVPVEMSIRLIDALTGDADE
jgi:hypothetical protein